MFADPVDDEAAITALIKRRNVVASTRKNSFLIQLRLYYRFVRLGLHLLEGAVLALLCGAVFVQYQPYQRPVIRWWLRRFCRIFNIDVRVHGAPVTNHALWVSNHVSWLDIPVLGSQFPVYFLSKAEVANWPIIGWLARVAGTLFIKRGSGDAGEVTAQLAAHLRKDRNVLFFPEGTTTDGQRIKRFFHKLFAAAITAQTPIQPVLVCYRDEDDALHPYVPFVGDDEFLSHVADIFKGGRIAVDVLVLPVEPLVGRDPRQLARHVEQRMSEALQKLQKRD